MNKVKAPALNKVPEDIPGVKKPAVVEKKPENKEAKPPKEIIPDYDRGYTQGFESGFKLGLKNHPDLESARTLAFDQGVKHIVSLAEDFLVKQLKLASRDALAESGKIPAWWIATLVTNLSGSTSVIPRVVNTRGHNDTVEGM